MKYPCSLIQDLLPLYHDGVCSEESNKIIEAHLSECSSCKDYYNSLCEADENLCGSTKCRVGNEKSSVFSLDKKEKYAKSKYLLLYSHLPYLRSYLFRLSAF